MRSRVRLGRPSFAAVLAGLALFVALGGPAAARDLISGKEIKKNSVTAKQIKNSTLTGTDVRDASLTAADMLDGSLTGTDMLDGSLSEQELDAAARARFTAVGDGAVGSAQLAANSVDAGKVRDGGLAANDVGRFAGTLSALNFGTIAQGACTSITSTSLTPLVPSQDLRNDAIVVTPPQTLPDGFSILAKAAAADQITVTLCNVGGPVNASLGALNFRYVTVDAP